MQGTGIAVAAGHLPAILTCVAIGKPSPAVPLPLTVYLGF